MALFDFWRPNESPLNNSILQQALAQAGVTIPVRENIVDRTGLAGMTPQAVQQFVSAAKSAQDAGMSRFDITAAKGGGHKSHFAGTEWDVIGYKNDANGDPTVKWTPAERVAVAQGARDAGANRFGLYSFGKTTGGQGILHFGYGPPSFGAGYHNVVWGKDGLTGGAGSADFTDPAEKAFAAAVHTQASFNPVAYLGGGKTADASMALAGQQPQTPAEAAAAAQGMGGGRTLRKGMSGEDVRQLQQGLAAEGFNPGAADGKYGARTEQAVRSFQRTTQGLAADGVAGPRTMAAMAGGALQQVGNPPGVTGVQPVSPQDYAAPGMFPTGAPGGVPMPVHPMTPTPIGIPASAITGAPGRTGVPAMQGSQTGLSAALMSPQPMAEQTGGFGGPRMGWPAAGQPAPTAGVPALGGRRGPQMEAAAAPAPSLAPVAGGPPMPTPRPTGAGNPFGDVATPNADKLAPPDAGWTPSANKAISDKIDKALAPFPSSPVEVQIGNGDALRRQPAVAIQQSRPGAPGGPPVPMPRLRPGDQGAMASIPMPRQRPGAGTVGPGPNFNAASDPVANLLAMSQPPASGPIGPDAGTLLQRPTQPDFASGNVGPNLQRAGQQIGDVASGLSLDNLRNNLGFGPEPPGMAQQHAQALQSLPGVDVGGFGMMGRGIAAAGDAARGALGLDPSAYAGAPGGIPQTYFNGGGPGVQFNQPPGPQGMNAPPGQQYASATMPGWADPSPLVPQDPMEPGPRFTEPSPTWMHRIPQMSARDAIDTGAQPSLGIAGLKVPKSAVSGEVVQPGWVDQYLGAVGGMPAEPTVTPSYGGNMMTPGGAGMPGFSDLPSRFNDPGYRGEGKGLGLQGMNAAPGGPGTQAVMSMLGQGAKALFGATPANAAEPSGLMALGAAGAPGVAPIGAPAPAGAQHRFATDFGSPASVTPAGGIPGVTFGADPGGIPYAPIQPAGGPPGLAHNRAVGGGIGRAAGSILGPVGSILGGLLGSAIAGGGAGAGKPYSGPIAGGPYSPWSGGGNVPWGGGNGFTAPNGSYSNSPFTPSGFNQATGAGWTSPNFNSQSGGPSYAYSYNPQSGQGQYVNSFGNTISYSSY